MVAKFSRKKVIGFCRILLCISLLVSCESEIKPLPSSSFAIKSFKLGSGQLGNEVINYNDHTINLTILSSMDLAAITPTIEVADGATVSPRSGEAIDVSSDQQYTYTVVSASGREQLWTVKFNIADADYQAYIITSAKNDNALGIQGDLLYNNKYWDHALVDVDWNGREKWQKWHVIFDSEENGTKYYTIRNMFSGLYLAAPDGDDSKV